MECRCFKWRFQHLSRAFLPCPSLLHFPADFWLLGLPTSHMSQVGYTSKMMTVIWFSPLLSFSIFPFLQIWGKLKAWELVRLWKVLQRLSSDWHCFLGFLEFSQPETDLSWNDGKFSAVLQRCGECPQNLNYRRGWQFLLHLFSPNCYRHLVTKVIFLSSGFSSLCQRFPLGVKFVVDVVPLLW